MTSDRAQTAKKRRLVVVMGGVVAIALVVGVSALVNMGGDAPAKPGVSATSADPARLLDEIDLARKSLRQGEAAKAEALLRKTTADFPDSQDAWILRAEAALSQGRAEEAHDAYERAIGCGEDHAELRYAAGMTAAGAGRHDRAVEHFWRAQQLAPTNPKHPLFLATVQRKMGEIEEAKKNLLIAARLDPALAEAWGSLAAIALDENALSVGLTHIRRARESAPRELSWRLLEAKILRRSNKPDEAIRLLSALDEGERLDNPGVRAEIALCFALLQRPEDAARLYADAVDRAPQDATLLFETATWHERAGDLQTAIVYADRASRLGHAEGEAMARRLRDARAEAADGG